MEEKKKKRRLSLSVKILIGMALGIILGLIFRDKISYISFIGDIFMHLLRMCIYPLVFFSIIRSVASIKDIIRLRKVGITFLIYVIIGSAICAILGAVACLIIKPGLGLDISALASGEAGIESVAEYSFIDTLVGWIPENPFAALSEGNMIQLILFAIFFGVILSSLRNKVESSKTLFTAIDAIDEVMNKMVGIVLELAPYGVCVLVADMIGTTGLELIGGVGKYILAYYIALGAIVVIVYPLLIKFVLRLKVGRYFKNILPIILMAATTMSSSGTLPVTMRVTKESCGAPEDITNLLAPIGATVNMQGAAASQCTYAFFTMYLYGLDMKPSQLAFIILIGVVMAIGGSGVPGGGVIMCTVMLNILNMPLTIVPIIAGIFPLLDFGATVMNVLGDNIGILLVAKRSGELNEDIFYGRLEAAK